MPEATPATFQNVVADIAAMVQNDATGGSTPPPAVGNITQLTPPPAQSADPTPTVPSETPSPIAPTAKAAPGTLGGKFKNEDEAIRGHHLLIHSLNASKSQIDSLQAKVAAYEAQHTQPTPLSPGRADPGITRQDDPDDEKWRTAYGIEPADLDARVARGVAAALNKANEPIRAMQAADAYILTNYPDYPVKSQDVNAFVAASEPLRARVGDLWSKGLYGEAMEIGYLAYDNALRVTTAAQLAGAATTAQIDQQRGDATSVGNQAGGPREVLPDPNSFPRSAEDWARLRQMKVEGKDEQVRDILFKPFIAHIPELNPVRR